MANFTEDSTNKRYPNEYELWSVLESKWDFLT